MSSVKPKNVASLYRNLLKISESWPGFNAARDDRNLSLHIERQTKAWFPNGENSKLSDKQLSLAQKELESYQQLKDDVFKNKFAVDFGPLPRMAVGERHKLSASTQLKLTKRVRDRFNPNPDEKQNE